jgi:hypothetical protein
MRCAWPEYSGGCASHTVVRKIISGSGVASLTFYFHRFCHHLHPLNALQSPPTTPLHPTYPHQSFPQIPPESTNIIILYLPPVRPSIFPATIILSHYLQLINSFSYLPSRNHPHLPRRLPHRLSTLDSIPPTPKHTRAHAPGHRGDHEARSSLAGNTVKTRCCLSLRGRFCFPSMLLRKA